MWVILAFLAAIIWATTNIIDKYVLSHELKDPILATTITGIGPLIIFSIISLSTGLIILPITTIIATIAAGIFYSIGIGVYYFAIRREEVSRLIPILSIGIIFVLIAGFLFFQERFAILQYLGIALIILGAILISIREANNKLKLKYTTLFIGAFAAILFATRDILVKFTTLQTPIWPLLFWMGVGTGLVSLTLFILHHPHIRKQSKKGVKHLFLVGLLGATAFLCLSIAISKGAVSLATTIVKTQPIFVFLLALIVTTLHPKLLREKFTKPILIQKIIAIALVVIGSILLI